MKRIIGVVALFLVVSIFSNVMISADDNEEVVFSDNEEELLNGSEEEFFNGNEEALLADNETHLVSFDPNDGIAQYGDFYRVTISDGGKVTSQPDEPKRDGYFFKGWAYTYDENDNPVLWDFENHVVTDNTTLWAEWEEGYIVSFDPNDGVTQYGNFYKVTVAIDSKVTSQPDAPKRDGYVFKGWAYVYDENDNPVLWDFENYIVTDNTTLWAEWEEGYIVTFDPNDGVSQVDDFYKITVSMGGKVTSQPDMPKRDGYVFKGWSYTYDNNNNPILWDFENGIVAHNMRLLGVWEANNKPEKTVDTVEKPVVKGAKRRPMKIKNVVHTNDINNNWFMYVAVLLGALAGSVGLYSKQKKNLRNKTN